MRILIPFLSLILAHVALAAEEPTALVELRQGWEAQRAEAQAKVDKLYLEELEELKKNFTKAGNIADGMAVHNEIEGGKQGDKEPVLLTKVRQARDKSLKKALTPLDKRYWRDLKKLKADCQEQGDLAGVVAADAEIEKVVAGYRKQKAQTPQVQTLQAKNIDIITTIFKGPLDEYLTKHDHQYHGKANVIRLHPISGGSPGSIDLSPHTKKNTGQIKLEARDHENGDCILRIIKDNKLIKDILMNQDKYQTFEINYDKEEVKIEVHAGGAKGWYCEHLYVHFPEISVK